MIDWLIAWDASKAEASAVGRDAFSHADAGVAVAATGAAVPGSPSVGDPNAIRAGKARGGCAAVGRRAAGWGECAPREPVAEFALQPPRAAHRQFAGSNRTAQLGPSQVDAVERAGVDDDPEVDVEAGWLEAH